MVHPQAKEARAKAKFNRGRGKGRGKSRGKGRGKGRGGRGKNRGKGVNNEADSGLVEPVNLFGLSGEERFDAMFADPSSSNAQAASSKPPAQEAAAHNVEAEANVKAESNVEVAVEAEPNVEADAEARVEALSQPEAPPEEELDRRVRGPNVHSSPSTLAELAPPGCSILLNSYLAQLSWFLESV